MFKFKNMRSRFVKERNMVMGYNREVVFDKNNIHQYKEEDKNIIDRFDISVPVVGKHSIVILSNPNDDKIICIHEEYPMEKFNPCCYPLPKIDDIYRISGPLTKYMEESSEIVLTTSLGKKAIIKSIYLDKEGLVIE